MIRCQVYDIEHGSDHRAIASQFDIEAPQPVQPTRYLWKSAPWGRIRDRITAELRPPQGSIQSQTDHLIQVVESVVLSLTPKAKPSPYAKRWWTSALTELRQAYTYWRNKARSFRRAQNFQPEIERQAKQKAKEYHDGIRARKKQHWEDFLANTTNIRKASKYLRPAQAGAFDKIPPLQRPDRTKAIDPIDQSEVLLQRFFPPLPVEIADEPNAAPTRPVYMGPVTDDEIKTAIFKAKAPGPDGLPAVVWQQVWEAVQTVFQLDSGQSPSDSPLSVIYTLSF